MFEQREFVLFSSVLSKIIEVQSSLMAKLEHVKDRFALL